MPRGTPSRGRYKGNQGTVAVVRKQLRRIGIDDAVQLVDWAKPARVLTLAVAPGIDPPPAAGAERWDQRSATLLKRLAILADNAFSPSLYPDRSRAAAAYAESTARGTAVIPGSFPGIARRHSDEPFNPVAWGRRKGLTVGQAAALLGMTRDAVHRYAEGSRTRHLGTIERLAGMIDRHGPPPDDPRVDFNATMKRWDMTQQDLAEVLGVNQSEVSRYGKGVRPHGATVRLLWMLEHHRTAELDQFMRERRPAAWRKDPAPAPTQPAAGTTGTAAPPRTISLVGGATPGY